MDASAGETAAPCVPPLLGTPRSMPLQAPPLLTGATPLLLTPPASSGPPPLPYPLLATPSSGNLSHYYRPLQQLIVLASEPAVTSFLERPHDVSIAAGGAPLGGGAVSMSPPILTAGGSSPVGDTPPITSLLPPSCTPSIALPQSVVESEEVWLEHYTADGKVYYSHPHTHKTLWERPAGARIISPHSSIGSGPRPVPLVPFPPPAGLPVGMPVVPQRIWSEHRMPGPEGKVYYFNKITQQSVWEKPTDFDLVIPLPVGGVGPTGIPVSISGLSPTVSIAGGSGILDQVSAQQGPGGAGQTSSRENSTGSDGDSNVVKESGASDSGAAGENVSEKGSSGGLLPTPGGPPLPIPPQLAAASLVAQSKLQPAADTLGTVGAVEESKKEEHKGPRPIQSTAVPGTPWSVVFTSNEKMFFFNATTKKSVWKMPQDLTNNIFMKKVVPPWEKRVGEPASKKPRLVEDEEEKMDTGPSAGGEETIPIDSKIVLKEASSESDREQKAAALRAEKPLEERQAEFKLMLLEREVSAFSTWEKELPKFVFDPRYLLLLVRERKVAFEEFIKDRAEEERRERKNKAKEQRDRFIGLLEDSQISHRTTFSEFARLHGRDERFKAIEKKKDREAIFTEYLTELKKSSKEREGQQRHAAKSKTDRLKVDFFAMLAEEKDAVKEASEWRKVKGLFHHDARYRAIDSSSYKEELFTEYVKSLGRDEKQERIQASLREREREVALSRTAHEKEWGKERDQFRKAEAQEVFKALLVDMVRKPDLSWNDTKKNLRKDHRWELTDLLDSTEKEKLFRNHVYTLTEKKRLQFRKLLDETSQISLTMSWKKAKKHIKDDPRYKAFSDDDHQKREEEYDRFQRDKVVQAKNEFKALLKETKKIDYRTQSKIDKSDKHLKEIMKVLENDQRYLVLECIAEERGRMLMLYIDDLHIKGPPPPPTASNPSDRVRK